MKKSGYLKVVNDEHYHIMGKFMLAFTIFWAYIGFSQYMLIWYANIPEETIYFRLRNTESWWYFSQFLVIGRFFLPFPVLLLQATKKTKLINYVAVWILFMQLLDIYVIVLPSLHRTGFSPSILDLLSRGRHRRHPRLAVLPEHRQVLPLPDARSAAAWLAETDQLIWRPTLHPHAQWVPGFPRQRRALSSAWRVVAIGVLALNRPGGETLEQKRADAARRRPRPSWKRKRRKS